jgi:chloride channel 3/4/5
LEELCSFFPTHTMIKSFFAALVGTVVIQLIDPYRGKRVMYQVRLEETFYLFEMTSFILIGCIGGLLGAFFTKVIRRISTMNLDIFKRPILFASLIALFTSAIAYFNVFTRIDESELLENLFSDCANESADLCQYVNLT